MYWFHYSSHTSHHPSQTLCLPWISYATQKLMRDSCKIFQKQSEAFHTFLWPSLKQNFIAYRSSSRLDCIFEIHQLWQSGFSRVYSDSCCSYSIEPEIIKIGQSSHKMCSNNILNFQEYDNFKCLYKKSLETKWIHHVRPCVSSLALLSSDQFVWFLTSPFKNNPMYLIKDTSRVFIPFVKFLSQACFREAFSFV